MSVGMHQPPAAPKLPPPVYPFTKAKQLRLCAVINLELGPFSLVILYPPAPFRSIGRHSSPPIIQSGLRAILYLFRKRIRSRIIQAQGGHTDNDEDVAGQFGTQKPMISLVFYGNLSFLFFSYGRRRKRLEVNQAKKTRMEYIMPVRYKIVRQ